MDGGIDDLAIKTLVEELHDLDSIGQIFCLALGQATVICYAPVFPLKNGNGRIHFPGRGTGG